MPTEEERKELRLRLKEKIQEGKITRSSKKTKEQILDKTLKKMGIEKDKLIEDMTAVKKEGGLSINLNK
jgi:hypothetical protein